MIRKKILLYYLYFLAIGFGYSQTVTYTVCDPELLNAERNSDGDFTKNPDGILNLKNAYETRTSTTLPSGGTWSMRNSEFTSLLIDSSENGLVDIWGFLTSNTTDDPEEFYRIFYNYNDGSADQRIQLKLVVAPYSGSPVNFTTICAVRNFGTSGEVDGEKDNCGFFVNNFDLNQLLSAQGAQGEGSFSGMTAHLNGKWSFIGSQDNSGNPIEQKDTVDEPLLSGDTDGDAITSDQKSILSGEINFNRDINDISSEQLDEITMIFNYTVGGVATGCTDTESVTEVSLIIRRNLFSGAANHYFITEDDFEKGYLDIDGNGTFRNSEDIPLDSEIILRDFGVVTNKSLNLFLDKFLIGEDDNGVWEDVTDAEFGLVADTQDIDGDGDTTEIVTGLLKSRNKAKIVLKDYFEQYKASLGSNRFGPIHLQFSYTVDERAIAPNCFSTPAIVRFTILEGLRTPNQKSSTEIDNVICIKNDFVTGGTGKIDLYNFLDFKSEDINGEIVTYNYPAGDGLDDVNPLKNRYNTIWRLESGDNDLVNGTKNIKFDNINGVLDFSDLTPNELVELGLNDDFKFSYKVTEKRNFGESIKWDEEACVKETSDLDDFNFFTVDVNFKINNFRFTGPSMATDSVCLDRLNSNANLYVLLGNKLAGTDRESFSVFSESGTDWYLVKGEIDLDNDDPDDSDPDDLLLSNGNIAKTIIEEELGTLEKKEFIFINNFDNESCQTRTDYKVTMFAPDPDPNEPLEVSYTICDLDEGISLIEILKEKGLSPSEDGETSWFEVFDDGREIRLDIDVYIPAERIQTRGSISSFRFVDNNNIICAEQEVLLTITQEFVPQLNLIQNEILLCGDEGIVDLREKFFEKNPDVTRDLGVFTSLSTTLPISEEGKIEVFNISSPSEFTFQYSVTRDSESCSLAPAEFKVIVDCRDKIGEDNSKGDPGDLNLGDLTGLFPEFRMEIYNRIGRKVLQANKESVTIKNGASILELTKFNLPEGIYYYIVYPNNNQSKPFQNTFYLKK